MTDFQKKRVYDWQRKYVNSKGINRLPTIEACQSLIDYVWGQEGYSHPPVAQKATKKMQKQGANATRLDIRVSWSGMYDVVMLHELAHSINKIEGVGKNDNHGPEFMKIYIGLLVKYNNMDMLYLLWSAKEAGVEVNI